MLNHIAAGHLFNDHLVELGGSTPPTVETAIELYRLASTSKSCGRRILARAVRENWKDARETLRQNCHEAGKSGNWRGWLRAWWLRVRVSVFCFWIATMPFGKCPGESLVLALSAASRVVKDSGKHL